MKRLILMVASLATVLVTGAVFARADYRPNQVGPQTEERLDQGERVRFRGEVKRIDMRAGEALAPQGIGRSRTLGSPA